MNTYTRVIPRDFFNEAKLLKCFGLLALKILDNNLPDGITIHIEESGERFIIELDEDNNRLYIKNYPVQVNGEYITFSTAYNSKSNYPFYATNDDYFEFQVFDNDGNFTEEFTNAFAISA